MEAGITTLNTGKSRMSRMLETLGYSLPTVPLWVHSCYTPVLHTTGYTAAPRPACEERGPWAQGGRNPWVRASLRPKVIKGVTGEREPLRIVTPLFLHERMERSDRHRVTSQYIPMVRVLCAEWCVIPSIRSLLIVVRTQPPLLTRFTVG